MNCVVLCSHLPGEGHFRSEHQTVVTIECVGDMDYYLGVERFWNSDRVIVNVEHDIEVTDEHISTLLGCPHPLCSWAYASHWVSTGKPYDVISAGNFGPNGRTFLEGGEEWAEWSAIGLVKITPQARVGALLPRAWSTLELSIEDAVTRPWHMHWPPAEHHHW